MVLPLLYFVGVQVARQVAVQVAKKAAQEVGKKVAQEAAKKAAQEAAKKAAQNAVKKAAEKASKAKKPDKICKTCDKAKKQTSKKIIDKRYERPSGYRKGVRDKVWNSAKINGKVRDPLTGKVMKKSDPWDMGHKPGYEFRKHQQSAAERNISRKEFLNEHNNPKHYRPELPSSNRSHAGEGKGTKYLGKRLKK